MSLSIARRFDSLVNFLTGQGLSGVDRDRASFATVDVPLDTSTLQALINGDDIANRVVTALPQKALKDGFGLAAQDGVLEPEQAQEQAAEILAECDKLKVRDRMLEADAWGRGYGLGGLILGVDSAGAPDTPLDDEAVGALSFLTVVDRREITPQSYYNDPTDERFGEVEFYQVIPTSFSSAPPALIHESRLVRFGGAITARRERMQNAGCDYSVLQRVYPVIKQAQANWASVCALMSDMSQGVYKIQGLMDIISSGNEAVMQKRMSLLDMYRSTRRSILLDAEAEDFTRTATPMGGVNEVLEQTWTRVCAAAEMPRTVLFGTSPAGLNATGESDMRLWYDTIQAHREHVLAPRIERIVRLLSRTLGHEHPEAWKVTWPSLWQMTASEQAVYRFQVAQADQLYIANGVLLPEEVALSRFASGDDFDGSSTTIDADARKKSLEHSIAEMEDPTPPPPPVLTAPGKPGAPALPPEANAKPKPPAK
jgi:phage-related protein (TIGR01555 family)